MVNRNRPPAKGNKCKQARRKGGEAQGIHNQVVLQATPTTTDTVQPQYSHMD